ncbi:MAG: hypothetical protein IPI39_01515 [Candidatus Obscuribacter sp.]|nr:hypothetical protein [Candidatus Obscuribacter sp.]
MTNSDRRIVYFCCFLLVLFVCRFGVSEFEFADSGLQRLSIAIFFVPMLLLGIILWKRTFAKWSLVSTIFFGFWSLMCLSMMALGYSGYTSIEEELVDSIRVKGQEFRLQRVFDDGIPSFECLEMRRNLLDGFVVQKRTLLRVEPVVNMAIKLQPGEKVLRCTFTDGENQRSRTYSTSWSAPGNQSTEEIKLQSEAQ